MKIRVHMQVLTPYVHGAEEIVVPDDATDDEKDEAAIDWAESKLDVWWEDLE